MICACAAAEEARKFWHAAQFVRRAPNRNQRLARQILFAVSKSDFPPLRERASAIIKEQTT